MAQPPTRGQPHDAKTPIYLPGRDKPVGHVEAGTFSKWIQGSKHMLHTPKAICFDRCTLRSAQEAGAVAVQVTDGETGTVYRAPLSEVLEHCFPVRRGFGDQVGLTLDRWSINGRQPQAAQVFTSNAERKDAQLSLFGGGA